MGEMSGDSVQQQKISGDHAVSEPQSTPDPKADAGGEVPVDGGDGGNPSEKPEPKGVPTDVDDVFADGERNGMPVFDVSREEFYNNMKVNRRRLRFKNGTRASNYMQKTRYNRPFWIRSKEDNLMRKIK